MIVDPTMETSGYIEIKTSISLREKRIHTRRTPLEERPSIQDKVIIDGKIRVSKESSDK